MVEVLVQSIFHFLVEVVSLVGEVFYGIVFRLLKIFASYVTSSIPIGHRVILVCLILESDKFLVLGVLLSIKSQ